MFFDDVLIYSSDLDSHLKELELIFSCLANLKLSKCLFIQESLEYLGHTISAHGVAPGKTKIDAMVNCPVPTTLKQVQGFLGLIGFYRRLYITTLQSLFH